jgi:hypothetical protein
MAKQSCFDLKRLLSHWILGFGRTGRDIKAPAASPRPSSQSIDCPVKVNSQPGVRRFGVVQYPGSVADIAVESWLHSAFASAFANAAKRGRRNEPVTVPVKRAETNGCEFQFDRGDNHCSRPYVARAITWLRI